MYSSEIGEFLKSKGYRISVSEYLGIMKNSGQIDYVTFDTLEWKYQLVTSDGYEFYFDLYED
jgi:hypothetical protein